MSTVSSPASPFNIVDYANDLLRGPSGHADESQLPPDREAFLALAEAERACTVADDCLRNDLDAARQRVQAVYPHARCIAIKQTRSLHRFSHGGCNFDIEYTASVVFDEGGNGRCAFGSTIDEAVAKLLV